MIWWYNITEEDYLEFVKDYEAVVEDFKNNTGKDGFKTRLYRRLVELLDYKPLAYIPIIPTNDSDRFDWNDGSLEESGLRYELITDFCLKFENRHVNGRALEYERGGEDRYVTCGVDYPYQVRIGDDYNEYSMKIALMRDFRITDEIIDKVTEEFTHEAIVRYIVDEYLCGSLLCAEEIFDDFESFRDDNEELCIKFDELDNDEQWLWYIEGYSCAEDWAIENLEIDLD